MNLNFLNIYNNLIKLTRNKNLFSKDLKSDSFSNRLVLFFIHFAFFIKIYKNQSNKKEIQNLYDFIFKQIELSLREIGYGDTSINKKMKEYINYLYFIIDKAELWETTNLNSKLDFFAKYLDIDKESSFYVDYFDKYINFLLKNSFNHFTKDVISLKF
tara:strand:- start:38 stop:511 length:474 start_codon:yes stop_codon:yes gene_type:complete